MHEEKITGLERILTITMIQSTQAYERFAQVSRFDLEEIFDAEVSLCKLGIKFECKSITFTVNAVENQGLAFYVGEETDIMDEIKADKFNERIEQYDDYVIYHHKARAGSELHILGRIASICEWAEAVYLGVKEEQWQLKGLDEFDQLAKITQYLHRSM